MNKITYYWSLALILLGFWTSTAALATEILVIHTQNGPKAFNVEVADTEEEKQKGLMYRTSMARDHGMLFIWEKDHIANMWMKNTLISLDMLFIDSAGYIVYIARNTAPKSLTLITADRPVRAVLELPADTVEAQMIELGDRVEHSYFKP